MEAFRLRGIYSKSASYYSEDALCWPTDCDLPPIPDLVFGGPNGLTTEEKNHNGDVLRIWANKNRAALGLDRRLAAHVPSFHSVFRTKKNGRLRVEMVVEVIQGRLADLDSAVPGAGSFPFRGGVTLIVEAPELVTDATGMAHALPPRVRFAIGRSLVGPESQEREQSQRAFTIAQGLANGNLQDPAHFQANFGLVHEEY